MTTLCAVCAKGYVVGCVGIYNVWKSVLVKMSAVWHLAGQKMSRKVLRLLPFMLKHCECDGRQPT